MLLSSLMDFTPESHPGHGGLDRALSLIQNIASHLNEHKRKIENMVNILFSPQATYNFLISLN